MKIRRHAYNRVVRIRAITVIALCSVVGVTSCGTVRERPAESHDSSSVGPAFTNRLSHLQVEDKGVVLRILPDDTSGLPHQRIIVSLSSGSTVLIEHNTSVAPRVDDLKTGDAIGFAGEYIWNAQGGLVHWTHHDPPGHHPPGWLQHNGRRFE